MIEKGIAATLLADAGVTALAGTRVYAVNRPESVETLPAVVQERADTDRRGSMKRASDGLVKADVRVICWAADALTAKQLAEAARVALIGTKDAPKTFPATWGGYRVPVARASEDADDIQPPIHGEESGEHSVTFLVTAWFEE